jgi:hypothetical protein
MAKSSARRKSWVGGDFVAAGGWVWVVMGGEGAPWKGFFGKILVRLEIGVQ